MNRRGFIAALFAPVVAKWFPRFAPKPVTAHEVVTEASTILGYGDYLSVKFSVPSPRMNGILVNIRAPWIYRPAGNFRAYMEADEAIQAQTAALDEFDAAWGDFQASLTRMGAETL